MTRKLNFALSLAVGLLGGVLSRWIMPIPVLAQTPGQVPPAPSPAATPVPKDIRAQRFTVVNADGRVLGTFGIDSGLVQERTRNGSLRGNPTIKLFDETGKEIWTAGGAGFRTLSER
jgi:hypothetical protein